MTQVTCFLCEGINYVPVECKFYSMVQRMNQQAKDGLSQLLGNTSEDGKPKMEVKTKDVKATPDVTTKRRLAGGKQGRLPRNCSRNRESFPTAVVEYE
jgi:hypothetical protein